MVFSNYLKEGFFKVVVISISTSLTASAVIYFVDLFRSSAAKETNEKYFKIITQAGLIDIFQRRDLEIYHRLMNNIDRELDIVGYSLGSFYDSFNTLLLEKCNTNKKLSVRILIVDPASVFSKHREKLENNPEQMFKGQVQKILGKLKHENIKIRFISIPICNMVFRIDDDMFVGPHFYKQTSKSTLTIQLSKHGWLFDKYKTEFDQIWDDSSENFCHDV